MFLKLNSSVYSYPCKSEALSTHMHFKPPRLSVRLCFHLQGFQDRKERWRLIPRFGINDELTIVKNLLSLSLQKGLQVDILVYF